MHFVTLARQTSDFESSWYALYTRHQHEKTVSSILSLRGFDTFLPLYSTTRRWKDRTKRLSLPLFPCYVFLRGPLDRRLDILTTPGVHSFVCNAGEPARIPSSQIGAVRQAVEHSSRLDPHPFLKCGDRVRIKSGPLAGLEGLLVRKKNHFRLILSIELVEKSVAVEVDLWMVERTSRGGSADLGRRFEAGVPSSSNPIPLDTAFDGWGHGSTGGHRTLGATPNEA